MSRSAMGLALLAALAAVGPSARAASQDNKEKEKPKTRAKSAVNVFHLAGGGRLGVSLGELGSEDVSRLHLSDDRGALVREVEADSPAAAAGLKENDVIVRFDGEPVRSATQLARMVRETPGGRKVTLDVNREGAAHKLTVTLREGAAHTLFGGDANSFSFSVPEPPTPPDFNFEPFMKNLDRLRDNSFAFRSVGRPGRLGLSYQDLSGQLAKYFRVEDGVLVTEVTEGGAAEKAGVKAGDVIVKLNAKAVHNGNDLREELGKVDSGAEATITVEREGRATDLRVKLPDRTPAARTIVRPRTVVRSRSGIRL
jgi:serine protease Do